MASVGEANSVPAVRFTSDLTVTLEGIMGSDLVVVNSAKASHGKRADVVGPRERKLIRYLAQHQHTSPFRHCQLRLRLRCPEFLMRQIYKHVVGIEATSTHPTKDHAWNEISQRYEVMDELYRPPTWHQQHASRRQCADGPHEHQEAVDRSYTAIMEGVMHAYHSLIRAGVAREQARMILPLSILTEVTWTASLQALWHFVQLRASHDAQVEIREVARQIAQHCQEVFPVSWEALSSCAEPAQAPEAKGRPGERLDRVVTAWVAQHPEWPPAVRGQLMSLAGVLPPAPNRGGECDSSDRVVGSPGEIRDLPEI